MTGIARYAMAVAAGLAAMAAWSALFVQKGIQKERARVEVAGKKTNEKAKAARKAVEVKKPDEIRADLRRFCVDCDAK